MATELFNPQQGQGQSEIELTEPAKLTIVYSDLNGGKYNCCTGIPNDTSGARERKWAHMRKEKNFLPRYNGVRINALQAGLQCIRPAERGAGQG